MPRNAEYALRDMTLIIPTNLYPSIIAHLESAYPNEGAGLLLGSTNGNDKTVQSILKFENKFEAGEQYHRYLISAEDMFKGEMEAEKLGMDVIGVFHSHPDHPSQASEYDREHALPWYSYLIVSVQKGKASTAQSWLLSDKRDIFLQEIVTLL